MPYIKICIHKLYRFKEVTCKLMRLSDAVLLMHELFYLLLQSSPVHNVDFIKNSSIIFLFVRSLSRAHKN